MGGGGPAQTTAMRNDHPLCAVDEVPPGSAKRVVVATRALAVFNLDGAFFVTDDTCTHGFASLAEGFIAGGVVECPWHGGAFDIRSGVAVARPCERPIAIYPVAIRDGRVWADLGAVDPKLQTNRR